jgi:hypothetical protein
VSESEIQKAQEILNEKNIITSLEGCASFAGFMKMQSVQKFKKAVCILSGKLRSSADPVDEMKIYKAESFEEVDKIMTKNLQRDNIS